MKSIEDSWLKTELRFDRHRDTEVFVVSPPDEVLKTPARNRVGKFVDFFRGSVTKWQTTLGEVETTL